MKKEQLEKHNKAILGFFEDSKLASNLEALDNVVNSVKTYLQKNVDLEHYIKTNTTAFAHITNNTLQWKAKHIYSDLNELKTQIEKDLDLYGK